MSYYHCAPILLAPGAIILPGNWGRVLAHIGSNHHAAEREEILEQTRQQHYPAKPSRLSCCYALQNTTSAKFYQREIDPYAVLYAVELLEPNAASHMGYFNAIEPGYSNLSAAELAHYYWRSELPECWHNVPEFHYREILTLSPLRVVAVGDQILDH